MLNVPWPLLDATVLTEAGYVRGRCGKPRYFVRRLLQAGAITIWKGGRNVYRLYSMKLIKFAS